MLPRIVLVDDNPADVSIMTFAIRQTGASVELTTISNSNEVLSYLGRDSRSNGACDLVLLDLNMPGISGFELLEAIRGDNRLQGLPVIVLSGSRNPEEIERCYRLGANSYICKPTDLSDIMRMAAGLVDYWFGCVVLPGGHRAASRPDGAQS